MKASLDYALYRLTLARQCRAAYQAYREDYPQAPLTGADEHAREGIVEKLLLRAPVTLPRNRAGKFVTARNP